MAQPQRSAAIATGSVYSNTINATYFASTAATSATSITFPSWGTGSSLVGGGYLASDALVNSGGTFLDRKDGKLVVPKGEDLALPDGSVLSVDDLGNYAISDKDAKVVHLANRMREFNPYVNASDLMAKFIRYLGTLGLTRLDAGQIPIVLFINWLVIEAATKDGDPIPEGVVPPEAHPALKLLAQNVPTP